jgi:hypothetical protein
MYCLVSERPLQNGTLCRLSASGSNFNPRNIQYIPAVEIFAFLELEHKLPFFKGLFEKALRLFIPLIFSGGIWNFLLSHR